MRAKLCFQRYYYLMKQGQDDLAPNATKYGQDSSELKPC